MYVSPDGKFMASDLEDYTIKTCLNDKVEETVRKVYSAEKFVFFDRRCGQYCCTVACLLEVDIPLLLLRDKDKQNDEYAILVSSLKNSYFLEYKEEDKWWKTNRQERIIERIATGIRRLLATVEGNPKEFFDDLRLLSYFFQRLNSDWIRINEYLAAVLPEMLELVDKLSAANSAVKKSIGDRGFDVFMELMTNTYEVDLINLGERKIQVDERFKSDLDIVIQVTASIIREYGSLNGCKFDFTTSRERCFR